MEIRRNGLGLGFSIEGGPSAPAPWTNLIRVKKVFPLQPAWETGMIKTGDIIVACQGIPFHGLDLQRALDILRTAPKVVTLNVSRATNRNNENDEVEVPRSDNNEDNNNPARRPSRSYSYSSAAPRDFVGEFTVELVKSGQGGGFGFTLQDGHKVKTVVEGKPAALDGRLKPGDVIVSVNGVDCQDLSHKDLINFLRKVGHEVSLKCYRDFNNDDNEHNLDDTLKEKRLLRFEAKELVRSLQASRSSLDGSPAGSWASLPRSRGLSPHCNRSKNLSAVDLDQEFNNLSNNLEDMDILP